MEFLGVSSVGHLLKKAGDMDLEDLNMPERITAPIKKKLFNAVHQFGTNSDTGNKYWDHIPIHEMMEAIEQFGYTLLQEDNTPWEGMLSGADESIVIPIGVKRRDRGESEGEYRESYVPTNAGLALSWYKMPSGRYEITAYIS